MIDNIFSYFSQIIAAKCKEIPELSEIPGFSIETPANKEFGDFSTNVAMLLVKTLKKNPRECAEIFIDDLKNNPYVESVNIAGAGFINWFVKKELWFELLENLLAKGSDYGKIPLDDHKAINIEYVSANPTGPMHAGHARGAVIGDALANLLNFAGYKVQKEFYINDAGTQADYLGESIFWRYQKIAGLDPNPLPVGRYPGEYLIPIAQEIYDKEGEKWLDKPQAEWLPFFRDYGINKIMKVIKEDMTQLSVHHDLFFSERSLEEPKEGNLVDEIINILTEKNMLYRGILTPPKGHTIEDWEPREQLLLKISDDEDELGAPLQKSDGTWTYFAKDIAYHYSKYKRGFKDQINIWGADHAGHVKRIKSAVSLVTDGNVNLDIKLCHMVNFVEDGQPVKMSKRAGTFITLNDLLESVGKDVVRFIMLSRKESAPLDFDFKTVLEESKENPVFYIQYAYARICSVMRHAKEMFGDSINTSAANLSLLKEPHELDLIRHLVNWPKTVMVASDHREVHRISFYLYELANLFHVMWSKGREGNHLRMLDKENKELSLARLQLNKAVDHVLKSGLSIIGVSLKEEM